MRSVCLQEFLSAMNIFIDLEYLQINIYPDSTVCGGASTSVLMVSNCLTLL